MKTMKRVIISIIISFSLMSVYCYGWFVANWPCLLYDGQCPPPLNSNQSSIQSLSPSLGQLSIDAAGFFLQSNSDYQAFLKNIELTPLIESSTVQGTNLLHVNRNDGLIYIKLKNIIEKSIENMEMAHSLYYRVWKMSTRLERNPVILEKLAQFDYRSILEEKRLIPSIFQEVENCLKHGNMKGAFEMIYNDTGDILKGMKSINSLLEVNSVDISQCWEVNHLIMTSQLFGQYISQVFSEIRKSNM